MNSVWSFPEKLGKVVLVGALSSLFCCKVRNCWVWRAYDDCMVWTKVWSSCSWFLILCIKMEAADGFLGRSAEVGSGEEADVGSLGRNGVEKGLPDVCWAVIMSRSSLRARRVSWREVVSSPWSDWSICWRFWTKSASAESRSSEGLDEKVGDGIGSESKGLGSGLVDLSEDIVSKKCVEDVWEGIVEGGDKEIFVTAVRWGPVSFGEDGEISGGRPSSRRERNCGWREISPCRGAWAS